MKINPTGRTVLKIRRLALFIGVLGFAIAGFWVCGSVLTRVGQPDAVGAAAQPIPGYVGIGDMIAGGPTVR